MVKGELLLPICLILIGLVGIVGIATLLSFPQSLQEVDCYDRDWNKINGVTCQAEVYEYEIINQFKDIVPLIIIAFMLSVVVGVFGLLILWRTN